MSRKVNASWLTKLRSIDFNPKTLDEFKVKTIHGGMLSLLSVGLIGYLLVSELIFYLSVDIVDKMLVDGSRNRMVTINFDIEFPRMPCSIVTLESTGSSGEIHNDVQHSVHKQAIDLNGKVLSEGMKLDSIGKAWTNQSDVQVSEKNDKVKCGSCYGAGASGECCNTCEDVQRAYTFRRWNIPSLHTIEQCQRSEIEKLLHSAVEEGCRIYGSVSVTKVDGKVLFAPAKALLHGYISTEEILDKTIQIFDTSHKINYLDFGDRYPDMRSPLNGHNTILEKDTRGTYQYFLQVVPTAYYYLNGGIIDTNQYSVTQHYQELTPLGEQQLPMIIFQYTFSPIMFQIEQRRRGYLQFLTSLCAILGGVFTMLGAVDSLLFAYSNQFASSPALAR